MTQWHNLLFFLLCPSCNVLIQYDVSKVHSTSETSSFIKKLDERRSPEKEEYVKDFWLRHQVDKGSTAEAWNWSVILARLYYLVMVLWHRINCNFAWTQRRAKPAALTDVPLFTCACSRLFNTDFREQSLSNTKVSSIDRYRPGWPTITLVVGKQQLTGATEKKKIVTSDPWCQLPALGLRFFSKVGILMLAHVTVISAIFVASWNWWERVMYWHPMCN